MAAIFKKKYKSVNRRRYRVLKFYACIILTLAVIALGFWIFEESMMPIMVEVSQSRATDKVNTAIDNALTAAIEKYNLTSADFFINNANDFGKNFYISADTILINQICSDVAVNISSELLSNETYKIYFPIGIITGVEVLDDLGPNVELTVVPTGQSQVDYETILTSVGINQINFQIWLNVSSQVKIVNPMINYPVSVQRKISLVNVVYSGEIPQSYYNNYPQGIKIQ